MSITHDRKVVTIRVGGKKYYYPFSRNLMIEVFLLENETTFSAKTMEEHRNGQKIIPFKMVSLSGSFDMLIQRPALMDGSIANPLEGSVDFFEDPSLDELIVLIQKIMANPKMDEKSLYLKRARYYFGDGYFYPGLTDVISVLYQEREWNKLLQLFMGLRLCVSVV